ncbi:MAG TPA: VTT domain-containing protein [Clostridiales bacterium]|nr:MAG: SNARE associated Golgi protein [Firmicutes bacterium ADurb.Bin262]HOU09404.1 VTT domain-containing protein [Clostridiales bacterium]HQH63612.1 VTT domain-containing protein [Clostridiales bacterium]HQK72300.1 VTT domain-containing protein [Clostridiales bacterium]
MDSKRQAEIREAAGVSVRILVAGALFGLAVWKYDELKAIDMRVITAAAGSFAAAVAAVLGVYLLKSVVFVIPASLLYIYTGMAFDTRNALLINFAGILIEVTATFWLGKFLGKDYVLRLARGKRWYEKLNAVKSRHKISFLFLVRALPVFPIDFVSLFLGASGIGFWPYLLLSAGGIMPRVILFTLLGDGFYRYVPKWFLFSVAIASIPLALAAWLFKHFRDRSRAARRHETP